MGYWSRIKDFFKMKIELFGLIVRVAAIWAVIFIIKNNNHQQFLALACLIVAVIGTRIINEYMTITIDKFKKSPKGAYPFGGGLFDNTDYKGNPISPVVPEEAKQESAELYKDGKYALAYLEAIRTSEMGQWRESAKYIEECLRIKPDNIPLRIQLAIIYGERIGEKEKAIYHCKEVLKKDPKNVSAMFSLAVYTNHSKEAKFSLPIYLDVEQLIKEKGLTGLQIDGKLNIFVGHDFRDTNNKPEAKKRYEQAISILQRLAEKGDKSAAFWLEDARNNLKKLLETMKE